MLWHSDKKLKSSIPQIFTLFTFFFIYSIRSSSLKFSTTNVSGFPLPSRIKHFPSIYATIRSPVVISCLLKIFIFYLPSKSDYLYVFQRNHPHNIVTDFFEIFIYFLNPSSLKNIFPYIVFPGLQIRL